MLIRSQDKKFIVKFDNIAIQATPKDVICYDMSELENDSYISLGNYSTEEKTFKVLDMIQEAYTEYKITCTFLTGFTGHRAIVESNDICVNGFKELTENFKKNMVFQMPKDSEVEV